MTKLFEWANDPSRDFMAKGYLIEGETIEQRAADIAKAVGIYYTKASGFQLSGKQVEKKVYDYIGKGFYSLSSPFLSNAFRDRGLPISCNNVTIEDDMSDIIFKTAEVSRQTQKGAGTSGYFGKIRPRGSTISTGGKADGPVDMMKLFETVTDVISQGSVRRGNFAAYLDVDHPDILEFLEAREGSHYIQKLSLGVCISDDFMNRCMNMDPKTNEILGRIQKKRDETGYPYIFFSDTVNRNKPAHYKDYTILASNLCVSGSTKILTDKGQQQIDTLVGQEVNVWNGKEYSKVTVRKTGDNQKLIKVTTKYGKELECTPYHKFYVQNAYGEDATEVRAGDLKVGDKLIKLTTVAITGGSERLRKAYTNGFYSGDGCKTKQGDRVYLYGDKRKLKDYIEHGGGWTIQDDLGRMYAHVEDLQDKFFVPGAEYLMRDRLCWLAGLLDSDGTVARNGENESLQIGSVNKKFLQEVQLMLQTLGIHSSVAFARPAGEYELPTNNGTGDNKLYSCQEVNRLLISSVNAQKLLSLGLECKRLSIKESDNIQRDAARFDCVESIEDVEGLHDTYCFTEPKEGKGVFNGILTGQCSEICQPSTEDESFVCCLMSMNLATIDDWFDTDAVEIALVMMDAVMEDYLNKIKDDPLMRTSYNSAKKWRAVGIGTLGYHTALQKLGYPFESEQARRFNIFAHKTIWERLDKKTQELAEIFGEPEGLKGTGRRNGTLTAIAPTTSSSFILGQVSPSIEPLAGNIVTKDLAKGKYTWKNPELEKVLESYGKNDSETWASINDNYGSVQHLDYLSDNEKLIFKTFPEISMREVVGQAADRQKYLDQSQSLNLTFHPETPVADTISIMFEAWALGVKTLYYQRPFKNKAQATAKKLSEMYCVACES